MQALLEEFRQLPDHRKNRVGYTHPGEILFLSLLAVLSGAQGMMILHHGCKKEKESWQNS